MPSDDVEVVVIGGGAAGIAAARRLCAAQIPCLLVEARPRLGGRAWTVIDEQGFAIDLGCGWLHSADRNPWVAIAQEQGATIDKSVPPWQRRSLEIGFPGADQDDFQQAFRSFFDRVSEAAERERDVAASSLLEPGGRWNGLISALATYISGGELECLSVKDFDRYEDSGVNWRVVSGLGSVIRDYGSRLPVALECPVQRVDHRGERLRIETAKGAISADRAIVAVPSTILAGEQIKFTPALPQKIEAAGGLPLGLNDKLFISLDRADEFGSDLRVFGHTDRAATAAYQFRPLGRPMIEAYFGGRLARELESEGAGAFFRFAVSELTHLFGNDFARRLKPTRIHLWGTDPFARGSYSFALPDCADARAVLTEPIDERLFFAGEACSTHDFSTAHGAFHTGVAAADSVIAARKGSP
jgi:monoamine oxidase